MDYLSGWCRSEKRLDGVTAIVTGCNTGIGKETVSDFYLRGARVIMACRDLEKANNAKKDIENKNKNKSGTGSLVVKKLDVASLKSVREFASNMLAEQDKLSILVNNAGVMMCPEGRTEDGFEIHIGTNHFGHALLTLLLLPRLAKNGPSRVVCVSSYLHKQFGVDFEDINFEKTTYDPYNAYCISKSANVLFATGLALKLKEHNVNNVTTYSLHPGVILTDIARHFSTTLLPGATWIFNNIFSWFMKSPRCGAQTSIYCAIDENCASESGLYYKDCAVATPAEHCKEEIALQFWNLTVEKLQLQKYNPFQSLDPPKELLL